MRGLDQSEAFTSIIEKNKGIFHKVARAYCPQEEDRKDLIQEMLIQVWNSYPRYNDQFQISTWIYRIALNVAISWFRKSVVRNKRLIPHKDQDAIVPDQDSFLPDQEWADETDRNINTLYRFINELKELERAIMILYLEEKSYKEIAEILGITDTNVATKISRIKSKLKERLQTHKP